MEKENNRPSILNKVRTDIAQQNFTKSQTELERYDYYKSVIVPILNINGDKFLQNPDLAPVLSLVNEIKEEIEQDMGSDLKMDKKYFGNFSQKGLPKFISSLPLQTMQNLTIPEKLEQISPEVVLAFYANESLPFVVRFRKENVLQNDNGDPDFSTGIWVAHFGFGYGADSSEFGTSTESPQSFHGNPFEVEDLANKYLSENIIKFHYYLKTEIDDND